MKTDQDKSSNEFIKKLIREKGYDHPSADFTDGVMKQLEHEVLVADPIKYKTLIPTRIWILIGIGLAGLFWFMLSGNSGQTTGINLYPYAERLNDLGIIRHFGEMNWNYMDNINVNTTVVYALLMLSIFLYLQFILLKRKLL